MGYPGPTSRSAELYERALRRIVGAVNSPARSYAAVGLPYPVFIARGQGAYLWDVDGNRYIDYLAAFAPGILGHAHPEIVETIARAAADGTLFGTPTPYEVELAERLQAAIPSLERVRLVSTGTEAVMSAVRVARAFTGRPKVVKFEGCYHGHSDFALIRAGSGPATLGQPDSAGIPESTAAEVIVVPYNDAAALEAALERWGDQVAAVLIEPIVGNMGIVLPEPGYLQAVRDLTHRHGALLIFDEVITAFRVTYGGAQNVLGVEPDLTTLGKAIGGGLPLGAYGGRADVMDRVAPLGPAYQAGTLAGNPLSVRVALKALDILGRPGVYEELDRKGRYLAEGVLAAARRHGFAAQVNRMASGFTLFFTDRPVRDYASASTASKELFARFFREMLGRGVLLAPSRFEAWFVQIPHSQADLDETLAAADAALAAMAADGLAG
ncbi:glutamate-1-semialdehyde 2,1-aminomutase [Caldinitratiruptor microaerophilus]|uniref:Glutamate-1-semialdehyde 2,1-aminomutase n=1 Tax=Caldinitratiruptor microaerophilus TaxID=671077 RepID=A0AA35CPC8_9FIRM|nr:glutamate-1-semialdehyde 2,1-aminomutase [Caldinitratiruptor microaerophilus]BDG61240.1 glutamate-1-semialdehyde 2,1-aminomutase 2 [Caldinitratiruptor microaerophilus]